MIYAWFIATILLAITNSSYGAEHNCLEKFAVAATAVLPFPQYDKKDVRRSEELNSCEIKEIPNKKVDAMGTLQFDCIEAIDAVGVLKLQPKFIRVILLNKSSTAYRAITILMFKLGDTHLFSFKRELYTKNHSKSNKKPFDFAQGFLFD